MKETIITKIAKKPGKTVAVFGGIHGNEKVGVMLIDKLVNSFEPSRGTVHLVYGNPRAIEQNVRFTETNLNRNFIRTKNPSSYEEQRAQELMNLLNQCDGLLDIHSYNEEDMQVPVFAICEEQSFQVVRKLPIITILSGFNSFQKGSTNGYMENNNKVGIVLELGSVTNPERYFELAQTCVLNFLKHFNVASSGEISGEKQTYLKVSSVHRRSNKQFSFTKKFTSFDSFKKGDVIAQDGTQSLYAAEGEKILFPRPDAHIGGESFWLLEKNN